jgi:hypothetical protein
VRSEESITAEAEGGPPARPPLLSDAPQGNGNASMLHLWLQIILISFNYADRSIAEINNETVKLNLEPIKKHFQVTFRGPGGGVRPPGFKLIFEQDFVTLLKRLLLIGVLPERTVYGGPAGLGSNFSIFFFASRTAGPLRNSLRLAFS